MQLITDNRVRCKNVLLFTSHIILPSIIMKSPKCIHRVIPAPCKLPRRKQALAPVGAVDDHRAVFRNLRLTSSSRS